MTADGRDIETRLVLRDAQGGIYAEGTMDVYCPVPSVRIKTDDGRFIWWRADLAARSAECPCGHQRGACCDDGGTCCTCGLPSGGQGPTCIVMTEP